MSFRPLTTLSEDVDYEIMSMTHKLFSSVPLPKMVERLGGVTWVDAMVAVILKEMSLKTKLSLILGGHQALLGLTDRFVHLWLTKANPDEKHLLENVLKEYHVMY